MIQYIQVQVYDQGLRGITGTLFFFKEIESKKQKVTQSWKMFKDEQTESVFLS